MKERTKDAGVSLAVACAFVGAMFLGAYIAMLLWNAVIPDVIGWGRITYWQMFMLGLLVSGVGLPWKARRS